MRTEVAVLSALVAVIVVWLFVRWRSPRPEFPPLMTSPDDPLMVEALAKAQATMAQFLQMVRGPKESALVKLRFVSNSNQIEHLWAEVLEVLSDVELGVRLVTPPVTHSGELERVYRCSIGDIEDWQVRDAQGKVYGGFSQRAMFAIARRDGVKLPRKLLQIEHEYRDA